MSPVSESGIENQTRDEILSSSRSRYKGSHLSRSTAFRRPSQKGTTSTRVPSTPENGAHGSIGLPSVDEPSRHTLPGALTAGLGVVSTNKSASSPVYEQQRIRFPPRVDSLPGYEDPLKGSQAPLVPAPLRIHYPYPPTTTFLQDYTDLRQRQGQSPASLASYTNRSNLVYCGPGTNRYATEPRTRDLAAPLNNGRCSSAPGIMLTTPTPTRMHFSDGERILGDEVCLTPPPICYKRNERRRYSEAELDRMLELRVTRSITPKRAQYSYHNGLIPEILTEGEDMPTGLIPAEQGATFSDLEMIPDLENVSSLEAVSDHEQVSHLERVADIQNAPGLERCEDLERSSDLEVSYHPDVPSGLEVASDSQGFENIESPSDLETFSDFKRREAITPDIERNGSVDVVWKNHKTVKKSRILEFESRVLGRLGNLGF